MTLEQSNDLHPQPTPSAPPLFPEKQGAEPQLEFTSDVKSQVRGYSTYNEPAGPLLRCTALLLDWGLLMIVMSMGVGLLQFKPRISIVTLSVGGIVALLLLTHKRISFLPTLGKLAWDLKTRGRILFQRDRLTPQGAFIGTLSTTLSILLALTLIRSAILENPVWIKAGEWKTTALPSLSVSSRRPFFYSLADWPRKFSNQSVYYTVLYEKGPPLRFVGHVSAQLGSPRIRLLIEGPKTPEKSGTPEELKTCLSKTTWSCLGIKEAALGRHFEEMSRVFNSGASSLSSSVTGLSPNRWKVKWFTIEPTPPAPGENTQPPTQGVYLSAIGPQFTQDRFILINANGQHQALILTRPTEVTPSTQASTLTEKTDEELKAEKLLLAQSREAYHQLVQSVRSMKVLSRLEEGRAWVNLELQDVQLSDVRAISDPLQKSEALAEIQRVLLSRISVDPASFDAYFHLAGTSYLLAKNAQDAGPNSNPLLLEALSAAVQNLNSVRRYAADLAPSDPRTAQIESLWQEIQKNSRK